MYEINNSYRISFPGEKLFQNKLLSDNSYGFNLHLRPILDFHICFDLGAGISCFVSFHCNDGSLVSIILHVPTDGIRVTSIFWNKLPECIIVLNATVSCLLLALFDPDLQLKLWDLYLNNAWNFVYCKKTYL